MQRGHLDDLLAFLAVAREGSFTTAADVRFWHKADIPRLSSNVRFWG